MTIGNQAKSTTPSFSIPVLVAGFLLGLVLSWGLISGDEQGRVNILQLVAIYIFLPILSLLFSTFSLLLGKSWNFAKLTSMFPFWSKDQQQKILQVTQQKHAKWYFFYQSQLAAISFSTASLLVLLVLLISTDVNFVWRSTLLDAEQLFPLLNLLAKPWAFWSSAQPSLELLMATQDSRLLNQNAGSTNFGDWWQFILAAQMIYAFLLRFVSIVICHVFFRFLNRAPESIQLVKSKKTSHSISNINELANVVRNIEFDYSLNNWCGLEKELLQEVEGKLQHSQSDEIFAGPLASHTDQMIAERWQKAQLLIVKGWEPPLAELGDFMQNGMGYLLPLDWDEKGLKDLKESHLNEWRRFILQLPQWKLLQLT